MTKFILGSASAMGWWARGDVEHASADWAGWFVMNVAHTAELDMNSGIPDSMSGNEGTEDRSEITMGWLEEVEDSPRGP